MKNTKSIKSIGNNIQLARLKKGLTQEELSEKCNVSSQYISAIESGRTSGSLSLMIEICNILGVSPNYIFGNTINNSNVSTNILSDEVSYAYLKLNSENKKFVENTINHLYSMQNKRQKKFKMCYC